MTLAGLTGLRSSIDQKLYLVSSFKSSFFYNSFCKTKRKTTEKLSKNG